jgi:hypothetical protein
VSYKDHPNVAFFLVYVREAHPVARSKVSPATRPSGPSDVPLAQNLDERVLAASACMAGLKLTLPVLIDTMDGAAEKAYRGAPAATAVIDLAGNVVFHSVGPNGCRPAEAERALRRLGFEPAGPASRPATRPALGG